MWKVRRDIKYWRVTTWRALQQSSRSQTGTELCCLPPPWFPGDERPLGRLEVGCSSERWPQTAAGAAAWRWPPPPCRGAGWGDWLRAARRDPRESRPCPPHTGPDATRSWGRGRRSCLSPLRPRRPRTRRICQAGRLGVGRQHRQTKDWNNFDKLFIVDKPWKAWEECRSWYPGAGGSVRSQLWLARPRAVKKVANCLVVVEVNLQALLPTLQRTKL